MKTMKYDYGTLSECLRSCGSFCCSLFMTFACSSFQAMARDPKNHFQLTPKQIRQKVVKFISIPEQFAPHAKARGMLDGEDQE